MKGGNTPLYWILNTVLFKTNVANLMSIVIYRKMLKFIKSLNYIKTNESFVLQLGHNKGLVYMLTSVQNVWTILYSMSYPFIFSPGAKNQRGWRCDNLTVPHSLLLL